MIMISRLFYGLGVSVLLSMTFVFAADELPTAPAIKQPVARQGLRLPDMAIHDPWILANEENKTYYLYSTARQNENGVVRSGTLTYKSKNLLDWDGPYIVFLVPNGIWAKPNQGPGHRKLTATTASIIYCHPAQLRAGHRSPAGRLAGHAHARNRHCRGRLAGRPV